MKEVRSKLNCKRLLYLHNKQFRIFPKENEKIAYCVCLFVISSEILNVRRKINEAIQEDGHIHIYEWTYNNSLNYMLEENIKLNMMNSYVFFLSQDDGPCVFILMPTPLNYYQNKFYFLLEKCKERLELNKLN